MKKKTPPKRLRHKWRAARLTGEAPELRGYGTAARPHRCERCGIFRFEVGEGRDTAHYYARMRTPKSGDSSIIQRWNHAPMCEFSEKASHTAAERHEEDGGAHEARDTRNGQQLALPLRRDDR